jgi:hypothetical protein
MLPLLLGALALSSLAACAASPASASTVVLDRDFDLGAGESARLEGSDLVVRFEAVTRDSRCPVDVTCITAGDAVVRLSLRGGGGETGALELHTGEEPREGGQGAFVVRLQALRPLPRAGQAIPASDYVATLSIRRP